MKIWQKINFYKKFIQRMVNVVPDADNIVIFLVLLEEYEDNLSNQPDEPPTIITLVNLLSDEVNKEQPEKDIIDIIGPYLKDTPIDKNCEFFAVLIAYFYYFEDLYSDKDLRDRPAFYKQIVIPLHLYREELEKDLVEKTLLQADKNKKLAKTSQFFHLEKIEPEDARLACEIFGSIGIPKKEVPRVVNKLLEKLDDATCTLEACRALANLPIPVDQIDAVIPKLLKITKSTFSSLRDAAFEALVKLPIPKNHHKVVVDTLHESIYRSEITSDLLTDIVKKFAVADQFEIFMTHALLKSSFAGTDNDKSGACEILGILGTMSTSEDSQRETIIDKLLKMAEIPKTSISTAAFNALGDMPIPKTRQEKVVNKLLESVDSKKARHRHACRTLTKVPIPKEQLESVIVKFKEKLKDPVPVAVCEALGEMPIPENQRHEIFKEMLYKADDTNYMVVEPACRTLIKMAVTEKDYEIVTTKILEKLDSQDEKIFMAVCDALKDTVTPKICYSGIIAKLLAKFSLSTVTNHFIRQTLGELPIPESLQSQVVLRLLNLTPSTNTSVNGFDPLGKVTITEQQVESVITKLCNVFDKDQRYLTETKIYVCKVLGIIKSDTNQSLSIFSRLFKIVLEMGQEDREYEKLKKVMLTTLLTLYEKLTLLDRIKMVAKLESQQEYVANHKPTKLPFLLSLIQSCQSKNVLFSLLISNLPVEQAASTINVIAGNRPR